MPCMKPARIEAICHNHACFAMKLPQYYSYKPWWCFSLTVVCSSTLFRLAVGRSLGKMADSRSGDWVRAGDPRSGEGIRKTPDGGGRSSDTWFGE